jgi:hypothetical protein
MDSSLTLIGAATAAARTVMCPIARISGYGDRGIRSRFRKPQAHETLEQRVIGQ